MKYFKSGELKKIEQAVEQLKRSVLDVVQSGEIAQIRTEFKTPKVPLLKSRPRVTPFFVCRNEELDKMKTIRISMAALQ